MQMGFAEELRLLPSTFLITTLLLCAGHLASAQSQTKDSSGKTSNVKTALAGGAWREDWTALKLPASDRPHVDTELLSNDSHPGFTRELLQVEWRVNDNIDLWVIKPEGVKNPPVVLYLYSYPSTNNRYQDLDFCKFLTRNGVAAVGFVSTLTGQRYHDRPMQEWFVSDLQEALATTVHDVQMILDYLASRGDLDIHRVGMFGDGSGASVAIMAAATDPRIKVLDLLNPWGDWPDWFAKSTLVPEGERADYLKPDFLKKVEGVDPVKWLPELTSQTARLQYIKAGVPVTPPVAKEKIVSAAPDNVKVTPYQDTKEFFRLVATTGSGFDWIQDRVKTLPSAGEIKTAAHMPDQENRGGLR